MVIFSSKYAKDGRAMIDNARSLDINFRSFQYLPGAAKDLDLLHRAVGFTLNDVETGSPNIVTRTVPSAWMASGEGNLTRRPLWAALLHLPVVGRNAPGPRLHALKTVPACPRAANASVNCT